MSAASQVERAVLVRCSVCSACGQGHCGANGLLTDPSVTLACVDIRTCYLKSEVAAVSRQGQ